MGGHTVIRMSLHVHVSVNTVLVSPESEESEGVGKSSELKSLLVVAMNASLIYGSVVFVPQRLECPAAPIPVFT